MFKHMLVSLGIMLSLACGANAQPTADTDVEQRVVALEQKAATVDVELQQLRDQLAKCHVEPVYQGRFSGWCPQGSFMTDIQITNSGSFVYVWVGCAAPRIVCR